jgi:hypothetical protein
MAELYIHDKIINEKNRLLFFFFFLDIFTFPALNNNKNSVQKFQITCYVCIEKENNID